MTVTLPEGTSLGTMQAPLTWVFSHTGKFVGKVAVQVQGGNGFLLIRKGEAIAYWFRYGKMILRGNAAREYLLSQGVVDLNLCRYTEEEFSAAQEWCREHGVQIAGSSSPPAPATGSDEPDEPDEQKAQVRPPTQPVQATQWSDAGIMMVGRCGSEGLEVLAGRRPADLNEHALCSSFGVARKLAETLGIGEISDFTLETRSGTYLVSDEDEGVLCLITTPDVPFGRIRTLLQRRE
ncbi:putative regulator of Ras-like GTPase activity (Roadblock/LC7/MglB family) [Methanofollis sp. W23]|uniref:hypothetical protein n=1 Tax=Methanofollis sp. W23 TaxID=2817849 RepID=UPI001AEAFE4D|nr:hypothetical protein [Methanofollis sp. W23]MBP2145684.1 putative regulator of Ras-like GTPase activity (Roadblock/LC7/MglB family) [Methanofollis sp. W23]